jgi:long-subunit fatty acid transport protein
MTYFRKLALVAAIAVGALTAAASGVALVTEHAEAGGRTRGF